MKIFFIILAALLIGYGIYRLCKGNKVEGISEILVGILEILGEILAAFV